MGESRVLEATMRHRIGLWLAAGIGLAGGRAWAAEVTVPDERGFVEAQGGYGLEIGTTPYLPTGNGTTFKHPLVNGYSAGLTGGWAFIPGLYLVGAYEYTHASSRTGRIDDAITDIQGFIHYHTITAGLRTERQLGPGFLFGELSIGLVLGVEVEIDQSYGAALAALPMPITGSGSRIDTYSVGEGGRALLGYRWPLVDGLYLSGAFEFKTFETENNGNETKLKNFVADPTAKPPTALTTTIHYKDDGGPQPSTYSVQDARVQVAFGWSF
jgi:hypothetical protein